MKTNNLAEQHYYNNSELWSLDMQIDEFERLRMIQNVNIIPETIKSLVDIGAGIGLFLSEIKKKDSSLNLLGIERSIAAIKASQSGVKIIQGTVNSLPLDNDSFDLVTAQAVIEHLPYYEFNKALTEIERVTKKYILIDVPYRERRLRAICPECQCEFSPHFHMRSFNKKKLTNLFSKFEVVNMIEVQRRDSILNALVRPFREHIFSGYPDYTLCPQCGFTVNKDISEQKIGKLSKTSMKRFVIKFSKLTPKVRVPGHIIVLYKKIDCKK